jgi:exopolyphosphatase/guanosine-5'-triphosphate,3'-diphosphate pyrophosphatase
MKRLATIDLGTNTFLLLISEYNDKLIPILDEQRIPRIGKDIDSKKNIYNDAFCRALEVLDEYKNICKKYKVDKIVAVGTSAIRDAKNKNEFIEFIKTHTNIEVEVLLGEEEALFTYIGGISSLGLDINNKFSVIDIGGGSTEIVIGEGRNIYQKVSLNIGSVRMRERYLLNDPPLESEVKKMDEYINEEISKLQNIDLNNSCLIGVAGTVTTLAMIDLGEKIIKPEKVNGYKLSLSKIKSILNKLKHSTHEEIKSVFHIPEGRADVIFAGVSILVNFMSKFKIDSITTSVGGLRYGIAIREFEKSNL